MQRMELLDYKAAGDFLGLSPYTLRRYVSQGRLPHLKLGGKLVRFEPDRLKQWLEARRVEPIRHGR